MKLYRKPDTSEWWSEDDEVDDLDIDVGSWTGYIEFEFDGTKNKEGRRHTALRVVIKEKEIEFLYKKLIQGRREEKQRTLKCLKEELRETKQELQTLNKVMDKHIKKLDKELGRATEGSIEGVLLEKLRESIESDIVNKGYYFYLK